MINVEVASPVALASDWHINPLRCNRVNFDKFSGPYSANGKLDGQKNHGVAHRKKEGSDSMSEQAFNLPAAPDADADADADTDADAGANTNAGADTEAEIELLACETHMSRELVKIVYSSERAKLERTARIKTYIPVLVHCRVKALLRRRA
jgi:Protein of unknown function (DUF3562)